MNSVRIVESMWQDLRYAVRQMRAHPAFTVVAVLYLALGIGANAALFQLLDALLLRSLPVKAPQQLITLVDHSGRTGHFSDPPNGFTYPQWENFARTTSRSRTSWPGAQLISISRNPVTFETSTQFSQAGASFRHLASLPLWEGPSRPLMIIAVVAPPTP